MSHCIDLYFSRTNRWGVSNLRNKIFTGGNAPQGFFTEYARTNGGEDFAVHMEYYVTEGPYFKMRTEYDPKLKEKYEFIRDHVFKGLEF